MREIIVLFVLIVALVGVAILQSRQTDCPLMSSVQDVHKVLVLVWGRDS
jgi:hypothetical protein